MEHVSLVLTKDDEIEAYAEPLRDAGWRVDTVSETDAVDAAYRISVADPDVVAISLAHDPEHGRRLADVLRKQDVTADTPIVFFEGDDEQSGAALNEVDNAVHSGWKQLPGVLEELTRPR